MNSHEVHATVEVIPGGPVHGRIRPPGSKSLTNRALICAAFADGTSHLTGALQSDDTRVMIDALREIDLIIRESEDGREFEVSGSGSHRPFGLQSPLKPLFIGNSGTTIRFLTAALSAYGGCYRLHGVPRMHQRPIGDLIDALTPVCEGSIRSESVGGCPPVEIQTQGWRQANLRVAGSVSSQYLSGLMMAAPVARTQAVIEVIGELVSLPYVEMTAAIMRDFGANVQWLARSEGHIGMVCQIDGRDGYRARPYAIEPDASAASYFWAAAAITGGEVTVEGLTKQAMQGDVKFVDCLAEMGASVCSEGEALTVKSGRALMGVDLDMNAISDTVQTLAVVALFAKGPTRVRGVAHNRYKETDRIGDLARELRKLGATILEHEDGLTIVPLEDPSAYQSAVLETYDDHRMAMSLSLAGLRIPGVQITNPACTGKTYPEFFADLERLIGRAHHWMTVAN